MIERTPSIFIDDIVECVLAIEEYIRDINFEQFSQNIEKQDAVIRRLEIIGEAANHIPQHLRELYANIPWSSIIGVRNIVIHEYFGIDLSIVWTIVTKDLPSNKASLIQMQNELKNKS